MSSFVTVIHAARQYKVQCTPGKILNDVLVEACGKANVNSDQYGLRYGKATLDLSLSVRLAHLPGGAKLDLVKVTSDTSATVNVALNLPETARKTAAILPSCTLWQALETFEQQHSLSILQLGQQQAQGVFRQQPVVQLMNKEYSTDQQLQGTSLASLGIKSGSAVIRVSFKPTDQLLSARQFDSNDSDPATTLQDSSSEHIIDAPMTDNHDQLAPPIVPEESSNTSVTPAVRKREIEILVPAKSNVPHYAGASELEDDLSMSVAQAKAYQASLSNRSQSSAPLLTQKYRDQQALERRLKTRPDACRVKFRFIDGTQVIGSFAPTEVSSELYKFVADLVEPSNGTFELEVLGDRKRIPSDNQELWRDLSFGKAVAMQVQGNVQVKSEYKAQGKDVGKAVAETDVTQSEQSQHDTNPDAKVTPQATSTGTDEDKSAKKMPKWLQKTLGKK